MKGLWRIVSALAVVGLTACEPIDDGGGGGGGGQFTRGFVFVREDRNVYAVDDQGDPNTPQRLTTSGGAYSPAVSRNGRSVVFVYQAGPLFELRTVPTSGDAQPTTVLASGSAVCSRCTNFRYPTFSPDGRVIVFAFNRGSGPFSLGRVNADGSSFQELTPGTTLSYGAPSFFPDGLSVLAPAGNSQFSQLARVSLSGGATSLTNNLGNEVMEVVNRAAVSPDGTRVVLDGQLSSGDSRIFVGTLTPFGPLTRLTNHPSTARVQDSFPSWMSTSQVGYLSNSGGTQSLYRINVSSSTGSSTLLVPSALEPSYGGP